MFYKNNQSTERLSKIGKDIYLFIILFCFTGTRVYALSLLPPEDRQRSVYISNIKYEAGQGRILLILESLSTH